MIRTKFFVFLLMLCCSLQMSGQSRIRVQGKITNSKGRGIPDVNVFKVSNDERLDMTDGGGNFSILVGRSETLKFTCIGYKEKSVKIEGQQIVNTSLEEDVVQLDEVTVVSEIKNKVIPEPTDIEIKGNYFHLKTRVPIPKEMFNPHRRLIIQPSIYDVTLKKRLLLRPVVYDGESYHITQKRMYDYDLDKDPLHPYIQVKETSHREKDIISYHDSLYIENVKNDYRADVNVSLENYHKVVYCDSFAIAQGTVNPLRMLEYKFDALPLVNERYLPKPMMQLMDTKGEVNLTFLIGRAELDKNNPMNQVEIDRLQRELKAVETNTEAKLQQFRITGVASPDGSNESNQKLAQKRTDAALDRILSQLSADTRTHLKVKSEAEVAPWKAVSALLRADGLLAEANEIDDAIKQYSNKPMKLFNVIRSKKFYKLVAESYLPKLRKVHYAYEYSIFRHLNDEEIQALYAQKTKELTRFEYYRMIAMTTDEGDKEKLCHEALAKYDNFVYVANELALLNIRQNKPNSKILKPYINKKAPIEVLVNQTITLLNEGKYQKADSVLSLAPWAVVPEEIFAYTQAFAGHYEAAYPIIAKTNPMNEVIMLLAMKRNQEAFEKAKRLNTGSAKEYYIRAIAANRLELLNEALMNIETALKLDPSLLETAKIDGDIIDLLPEDQRIKK